MRLEHPVGSGAGVMIYGMEHEKVTMKRVIIDTDPGIDDTAAIFLALPSPRPLTRYARNP